MIWHRRNQADIRHIAHIAFGAGLLCALMQPAAAVAEQTEVFTCTKTDQVRRIERVFEPGGAPCTVRYYRNNQPPQTVWRARESGSVCVEGARKMVQDFRAAGYSCTGAPTDAAAVPAPAPQSGSTGPAEPSTGAGENQPPPANRAQLDDLQESLEHQPVRLQVDRGLKGKIAQEKCA